MYISKTDKYLKLFSGIFPLKAKVVVYKFLFLRVKYYFIFTLQAYRKDHRKMNRKTFPKESQGKIHFVEIPFNDKAQKSLYFFKISIRFIKKDIEFISEYQKNTYFFVYYKSQDTKVFIERRYSLNKFFFVKKRLIFFTN